MDQIVTCEISNLHRRGLSPPLWLKPLRPTFFDWSPLDSLSALPWEFSDCIGHSIRGRFLRRFQTLANRGGKQCGGVGFLQKAVAFASMKIRLQTDDIRAVATHEDDFEGRILVPQARDKF